MNTMNMKTLNEQILDISVHLQSLAAPKFSSEIKQAVERNDRSSLVRVCRKAKIPRAYIGTVVSTILSVKPQKWPFEF
jgi:hypothetical protein